MCFASLVKKRQFCFIIVFQRQSHFCKWKNLGVLFDMLIIKRRSNIERKYWRLSQSRCRQGSAVIWCTCLNLKLNMVYLFTDFKKNTTTKLSKTCFSTFKKVWNFKIVSEMVKQLLQKSLNLPLNWLAAQSKTWYWCHQEQFYCSVICFVQGHFFGAHASLRGNVSYNNFEVMPAFCKVPLQ